MDKKKLQKLAGIQLNESSASYDELVEHMLRYLRIMSQMSGDSVEQTLNNFHRTVLPQLFEDLKQRIYMDQR